MKYPDDRCINLLKNMKSVENLFNEIIEQNFTLELIEYLQNNFVNFKNICLKKQYNIFNLTDLRAIEYFLNLWNNDINIIYPTSYYSRDKKRAIDIALKNENEKLLKLVLERGAKITKGKYWHHPFQTKDIKCLKILIEYSTKRELKYFINKYLYSLLYDNIKNIDDILNLLINKDIQNKIIIEKIKNDVQEQKEREEIERFKQEAEMLAKMTLEQRIRQEAEKYRLDCKKYKKEIKEYIKVLESRIDN